MPTLFSNSPESITSPSPTFPVSSRLQSYLASRRFSKHAFSSFLVMPEKMRFETQQESEPIILFLRRHPIVNIPWILLALLMLLAPIFVVPFFLSVDLVDSFLNISPGLPIILTALWYLVTMGFILSSFFVWYFTVNICTTQRVIDIDFFYILYKEFSEALLTKVEDVTFTMGGFIQAIFDFGDVFVTTAATTERIEFDRVPRPQEVVRIITELVQDALKK